MPCRVLGLEMLCDLRLDREDLRIGVEESLKPPSRPPKLPKNPLQLPKEQPVRASTRSTRYASSMYTMQYLPRCSCNTRFIMARNVAGALVRPKLSTLYSNCPLCAMNAVLGISSCFSRI